MAEDAMRWLQDAQARCMRVRDAYRIHPYCMDAFCEVATANGVSGGATWARKLETIEARTGMNEMLVRAHLHLALGAARLFSERIDDPAVLPRRGGVSGSVMSPPEPLVASASG